MLIIQHRLVGGGLKNNLFYANQNLEVIARIGLYYNKYFSDIENLKDFVYISGALIIC
jgi:hypothetical protein